MKLFQSPKAARILTLKLPQRSWVKFWTARYAIYRGFRHAIFSIVVMRNFDGWGSFLRLLGFSGSSEPNARGNAAPLHYVPANSRRRFALPSAERFRF